MSSEEKMEIETRSTS